MAQEQKYLRYPYYLIKGQSSKGLEIESQNWTNPRKNETEYEKKDRED